MTSASPLGSKTFERGHDTTPLWCEHEQLKEDSWEPSHCNITMQYNGVHYSYQTYLWTWCTTVWY